MKYQQYSLGRARLSDETSGSEQKGVMQSTGTDFKQSLIGLSYDSPSKGRYVSASAAIHL